MCEEMRRNAAPGAPAGRGDGAAGGRIPGRCHLLSRPAAAGAAFAATAASPWCASLACGRLPACLPAAGPTSVEMCLHQRRSIHSHLFKSADVAAIENRVH